MNPNACLKTISFFLGVILLSAALPGWVAAAQNNQKIYLIPVEGTVEPGMAAHIKRAVEEVKNEPDAIIVFEMDTFGGRVDAALEIVDTISGIPKGKSIAFVEKKAISAGALIALASGTLIMKNHTLIGDCAPIIQTSEGQKEVGEKTQTVLRAQFRSLAKKNNYPEVLAEAMVSKNIEVYRITIAGKTQYMDKKAYDDLTENQKKQISKKETIVAKGELLTMDDKEAFDLGFSKQSVENIDQALTFLGYKNYTLVPLGQSWSEHMVRLLQPFLPILMLLGIGAIYTEIKAPGFGIPGVIGIICLGLVFFNQHLVGLAGQMEFLLFLIGFLLLGVEVFILPGFGVAGISGLLVLAAGLVLSFQNFIIPDPSFPWEKQLLLQNISMVIGIFVGAFLISLFIIRFVLPRLATLVKGPYLSATLENSHVDSDRNIDVRPGEIGVALTTFRPSGKIKIGNKKIDAIAQGEFIAPGTPIRVESVEQNHIIVKPNTDNKGSK
ncbi:MAG: serine protease [Desulfobacteraceae bacterium]|nr:serine protease [Desulfobacteraceae bacterium]